MNRQSFMDSPQPGDAPSSKYRVCLIDDDPVFGEILLAAAEDFDIEMEYFESLEEMGRIARLGTYDLIICDFFLGHFNGQEIANYIRAFFHDIPLVMISGDKRALDSFSDWPKCVCGFVSKENYPRETLLQSLRLAGIKTEPKPEVHEDSH